MSSLLQSTGSSPYVLVHIVEPLATTIESYYLLSRKNFWQKCFNCTSCLIPLDVSYTPESSQELAC